MDYSPDFALSIDSYEEFEKRVMALKNFSDEVLKNAGIEKKTIKRPAYIFPHKNRSTHA